MRTFALRGNWQAVEPPPSRGLDWRATCDGFASQVATSLDGYIAGPGGEFDWIAWIRTSTSRRSWRSSTPRSWGERRFWSPSSRAAPWRDARSRCRRVLANAAPRGLSGSLDVDSDPAAHVRSLKARPGKDIWLFGGGELLRTLLEAGLVDTRGTSRGAGAPWRRYPDALAAGLASPTDVEHASRLPEVRNRAARVRGQPVRYRTLATVPTGSATSGRASSGNPASHASGRETRPDRRSVGTGWCASRARASSLAARRSRGQARWWRRLGTR